MLGWLYSGLYIFIIRSFKLFSKKYVILFWATQLVLLGMLISFPIQGYGLFSIIFSSSHIVLSYFFVVFVFKDLAKSRASKSLSKLFLKTALIFLFISSLGTWSLSPILLNYGRDALYYGAIQFFLHFQFNGWFIFAMLAIIFRIFETRGIEFNKVLSIRFYQLLTISCVLTFALAVSWSTPDKYIFWINSAGVIIQLFSLILFIKILSPLQKAIRSELESWVYFLLTLAFTCLVLKIVVQTAVAVPYVATMSYTIRNFVIGFIHLMVLGFMSLFILAMNGLFMQVPNKKARKGIFLFLAGFIVSEILLFLQGIMFWSSVGFLPYFYEILLFASVLMPVGIIIYYLHFSKEKV